MEKRKGSRETRVVEQEDGRALTEGTVCRPEARLFSWGGPRISGVAVTPLSICVCLVTVLPQSSLGRASAGLKNRQCLVLHQHLHVVLGSAEEKSKAGGTVSHTPQFALSPGAGGATAVGSLVWS